MAAAPLHSCSGLPGLRFSLALLAFWYTIVGSGSAVTVTQTPNFVNGSTGKNISFSCSVDDAGYNIFLYRQLPEKTELEVLGYLSTFGSELQDSTKKERLKAKWKDAKKDKMHLDLLSLQANDTGFYLCAAVYTMNESAVNSALQIASQLQNKAPQLSVQMDIATIILANSLDNYYLQNWLTSTKESEGMAFQWACN